MPSRSSSSSGRSSSSSRSSYSSSRSSYSRPSYIPRSTPVAPAPVPIPAATPVPASTTSTIPQIQVQQPGFFSNLWQGFGLGAGQSIAHNIFRSDPKVTHIHETTPVASTHTSTRNNNEEFPKEYIQCMKDNNDDKELCKFLLDSSKYMT